MRFLCLHGRGTCAKGLEIQTSSLRDELEGHEFIFVNGTVPTNPFNANVANIMDEYYGYIQDEPNAGQCREIISTMIDFVNMNGPFDGVLGFSEGGLIAALLLIEDARRPFARFRCGIIFSAPPPFDPDIRSADDDGLRLLGVDGETDGVMINVPTALIFESNPDPRLWTLSPLAQVWERHAMGDSLRLKESMIKLCKSDICETFEHHITGHDIPGTKCKVELLGALRVIERTIERCQDP